MARIKIPYTLMLMLLFTSPVLAVERKTNARLAKAFEEIRAEMATALNKSSAESPSPESPAPDAEPKTGESGDSDASDGLKYATFGTGCFWCTEAVFESLKGVKRVVSGYSGGRVPNPTYKQVCTGLTGHAEVIHMSYDPAVITYTKLLEAFWRSHDPTTLNRQGEDVGPQYRSVVFYHNDEQREAAVRLKNRLNASKVFAKPIVTEVAEFTKFYPAERYHQDYFARNARQPYCRMVIVPKMKKFRRVFKEDLKGRK